MEIQFECLKNLGIDISESKRRIKRFRKYLSNEKLRENYNGDYKSYLKSKHWKKFRENYFKNHTRTCYCCFEDATELHHNNYDNLFRETEKDVVPVCRNCHEEIHTFILNEKEFNLSNAHELYRQYLSNNIDT
jgi:hypothetical protein